MIDRLYKALHFESECACAASIINSLLYCSFVPFIGNDRQLQYLTQLVDGAHDTVVFFRYGADFRMFLASKLLT